MRPFARALIAVSFASLAAGEARADVTKEQCIDANGRGQALRHDGKLSAARAELQSCVSASCPAMVRDDCAWRLDELDRAQPSVVFEVKDGAGADVIDVRVSIDGELLAGHLDGTPLRVEPGAHVFSFEAIGHAAVTDRVLVREGEAGRHERVVLDGGAALGPSASSAPSPAPTPPTPIGASAIAPSGGLGTRKSLGLAIGGAGVVGLGVGAAFGWLASSAWSSAKIACGGSPNACVDEPSGSSHHATAVTDGTGATVAFVGGGALLAAGAVLFFVGHGKDAPTQGVALLPGVAPGQAGLSVLGAF
jgi:hypothetical protein